MTDYTKQEEQWEAKSLTYNMVKNPSHYQLLDTEAIEVIARTMTETMFYGYCLGNELKYRLRAGKKGDALEDLAKADEYELIFNRYKHYCIA